MQYVDQLELNGKIVFIRCDIDVPFDDDGQISDDHRLISAIPCIKLALDKGAKVLIAGHLGRPDGKRVEKLSAKPVAERLAKLLGKTVKFSSNCIGEETKKDVESLEGSEILVLENLRFHSGEKSNDAQFASQLADLADVYVNNAFATAHRAHASTSGMCSHFSEKAAGLTIKSELEYFEKALQEPKRPLVVIFGGAKISTKIKAIKNVARKADFILLGGAMANTFFKALGHQVGTSLFEEEQLNLASEIHQHLEDQNCKLILPKDVVVAEKLDGGAKSEVRTIDSIGSNEMALDIGPESVKEFSSVISEAETVVWNGPMGVFEIESFAEGTYGIVDALTASDGLTVVGGGDTDLALHHKNALDKVSYVSTGGGSFLALLEGSELPALKALD